MQTRSPLEEVPSLVKPIFERTLLGIILWFALESLCAVDSSNIGNCHFIRRRILRKASVRLSFSSPGLLRHTIVSNEERMAGELVERSTPWRVAKEYRRGWMKRVRWEHNDCIQRPSTSQRSAVYNDLTKLILIFEHRKRIERHFANWVWREDHAYKRHEQW